jgi:hypothetical protein
MLAFSAYGSAGNRSDIIGLDAIAPPVVIALFNETDPLQNPMTNGAALTPVVGVDGSYTFTYTAAETSPGDVVTVTITGATGFEMTASTFTSV